MRAELFERTESQRLAKAAEDLRKRARGMPAGVERDLVLKRARQAETASRQSLWMSSPGLKTPR